METAVQTQASVAARPRPHAATLPPLKTHPLAHANAAGGRLIKESSALGASCSAACLRYNHG